MIPTSYKEFMDPYQEEVINRLQEDLDRQRLMQAKSIAGAAAGRGAFGGSREMLLKQNW